MKWIFVFSILVSFNSWGNDDSVDLLGLTALLVRDGNFSRAELTMNKLDQEDSQSAQGQSLWGLLSLHKKKYGLAISYFKRSLKLGIESKDIYLYLAESHLKTSSYDEAQKALSRLGPEQKRKWPYFLVQAEVYWRQNKKNRAWQILRQAGAQGLPKGVLVKKKFAFYMEEQLFQSAFELARSLLPHRRNFSDVLAMSSQLRQAKQYVLALRLNQSLAFQDVSNETLLLEMTQNYLALGEKFSAALVLEEGARSQPSLAFEASELLRQLGFSYRARYLNMQNPDPGKRLTQQFSIYLESENYKSIGLLVPQLQHHNLLEDPEIRYALAYSLFKNGDFARSEKYLSGFESADLFAKSGELRKEIEKCKDQGWACAETL